MAITGQDIKIGVVTGILIGLAAFLIRIATKPKEEK